MARGGVGGRPHLAHQRVQNLPRPAQWLPDQRQPREVFQVNQEVLDAQAGESGGPPQPTACWPRPAAPPRCPTPLPRPAVPLPVPPAPLTVQPSRAVWYSAASVASRSSSWYRGQLRVGNLRSWGKLRLRGDHSVMGGAGASAVGPCLSQIWLHSVGRVALPSESPAPRGPCCSKPAQVPGSRPARPSDPSLSLRHLPRDLCLSPPLTPWPCPAPDLVLSDGHRVHRDGPPGSLRAPRGSLREQPCEVGLSALQCPVEVGAANIHLGRGEGPREPRL